MYGTCWRTWLTCGLVHNLFHCVSELCCYCKDTNTYFEHTSVSVHLGTINLVVQARMERNVQIWLSKSTFFFKSTKAGVHWCNHIGKTQDYHRSQCNLLIALWRDVPQRSQKTMWKNSSGLFWGVRNGLIAFQFVSMGKIDLIYKLFEPQALSWNKYNL